MLLYKEYMLEKCRTRNNHKKYTIRKNRGDDKNVKRIGLYIDENGIEHSLNKNKNWLLLDDPEIPKIKKYTGGFSTDINYHNGRNCQFVNGVKKVEYDDTDKGHIELPFEKNEYPLNRETHSVSTIHDTSHKCYCSCQQMNEFRGFGFKAKKKCRGMKKMNEKHMKYFDEMPTKSELRNITLRYNDKDK